MAALFCIFWSLFDITPYSTTVILKNIGFNQCIVHIHCSIKGYLWDLHTLRYKTNRYFLWNGINLDCEVIIYLG